MEKKLELQLVARAHPLESKLEINTNDRMVSQLRLKRSASCSDPALQKKKLARWRKSKLIKWVRRGDAWVFMEMAGGLRGLDHRLARPRASERLISRRGWLAVRKRN